MLAKYQAEVERWDSEAKRLQHEVDRGVVNPQNLLQATNQLKSSIAAQDAAKATVIKAEDELLARRAALSKAKVDVRVAEADLKVAESEEKRLKAWVDYLVLPAPYDGVIVARNANTFDFVLPGRGDPSAFQRGPYLSPSGLPRRSTWSTAPTSSASSSISPSRTPTTSTSAPRPPCSSGRTATSRSRHRHASLLGAERQEPHAPAEIDLLNPGSQILPGMYGYAKVIIERPGVPALPVSALMRIEKTILQIGEKTFCWIYEDGQAKRIEVETGLSDGEWIEVTNRQTPTVAGGVDHWTPIDGTEQVILGDLSMLAEGSPVKVAPATATNEAKVHKVAHASPPGGPLRP